MHRLEHAAILARLGEHARAAKEANPEASGPAAGDLLYQAACVQSLCAAAASRDGKVEPAERTRLVKGYAAAAVRLLARAHEGGYFRNPERIERLERETVLAPLRGREDF